MNDLIINGERLFWEVDGVLCCNLDAYAKVRRISIAHAQMELEEYFIQLGMLPDKTEIGV